MNLLTKINADNLGLNFRRCKMPGTKPIFQKSQNFVEVHFQTPAGAELMAPIKIFRSAGESYQIEAPVIDGYLLIHHPEPLTRTMGETSVLFKLIYARIGSLRIYQRLDDLIGESIKLKNSKYPDQIEPVELPAIPGKTYYQVDEVGIGNQVENPKNFLPADSTRHAALLCLTDEDIQELGSTDLDVAHILKLGGIKHSREESSLESVTSQSDSDMDDRGSLQESTIHSLEQAVVEISKAISNLSQAENDNRDLIQDLVTTEKQMLGTLRKLLK